MGILTTQDRDRRYSLELAYHGPFHRKTTELPVHKLNAIFLESSGTHGGRTNVEDIFNNLDSHTSDQHTKDIVKKCEQHGTEIWLGDVKPTKKEALLTLAEVLIPLTALAGSQSDSQQIKNASAVAAISFLLGKSMQLLPGHLLSRKGNANKRAISRRLTEWSHKQSPLIAARNLIMYHKIRALAEKTHYKKIGAAVGAHHVGIATLLEKGAALTQEQRNKIAARGVAALKMYRCIYDKEAEKWKVEKHSL